MTDFELLKRYVEKGDERAFAELMGRHVDWVYSACRRQVRDAGLAGDVTQAVFLTLAQKAGGFSAGRSVSGWLFITSRYAALSALKMERRRRHHERRAAIMNEEVDERGLEEAWTAIEPRLDEGLARLKGEDREAIVLRFFRGMSHEAMGEAMGISEEAARKRVERAVGRLRKKLGMSGAGVGAAGFAAVLSKAAAQGAPAGLGGECLGMLKTGASEKARMIMKGMGAMKKMFVVKMVLVSAVAAVLVGTGIGVMAVGQAGAGGGTKLGQFDLNGVAVIHTEGTYEGVTVATDYFADHVESHVGAEGWKCAQYTIGGREWDYREGGTVMFEKKPVRDSGAMLEKVRTDLLSLRGAPAVRVETLDVAEKGSLYQAYRLKDGAGQSVNTVVWIDGGTGQPARMKSDEPAMDMTFRYKTKGINGVFEVPKVAGVTTVKMRDFLEKRYPLEGAVFKQEEVGQVFAVHEAVQDAAGIYHVVCSSRLMPGVREALKDVPDDEGLGKFMMDDRAELPFHYIKVAEFSESGMQVMYMLGVPVKGIAPEDLCQLPVTIAASDAVLDAVNGPDGDKSHHDAHISADVVVKAGANVPTAEEFAGRAYEEVSMFVGTMGQTTVIGPRKDAGLSTKGECVAEMERELKGVMEGNP